LGKACKVEETAQNRSIGNKGGGERQTQTQIAKEGKRREKVGKSMKKNEGGVPWTAPNNCTGRKRGKWGSLGENHFGKDARTVKKERRITNSWSKNTYLVDRKQRTQGHDD